MPPGSDCCRACPSDRGSAPAVSSPRSGRAAPADLAGPKARCACNLTPTCPRPSHPLAPSQETRALCASSARRCGDRVPAAARNAGRVASARQLPARSRSPAMLERPGCRAPRRARRKRLHRSRRYQTACSCRQDREGGSRVPNPRRGAGADSPGVAATRQMGDATGGSVPLAKRCCATTHRLPSCHFPPAISASYSPSVLNRTVPPGHRFRRRVVCSFGG